MRVPENTVPIKDIAGGFTPQLDNLISNIANLEQIIYISSDQYAKLFNLNSKVSISRFTDTDLLNKVYEILGLSILVQNIAQSFFPQFIFILTQVCNQTNIVYISISQYQKLYALNFLLRSQIFTNADLTDRISSILQTSNTFNNISLGNANAILLSLVIGTFSPTLQSILVATSVQYIDVPQYDALVNLNYQIISTGFSSDVLDANGQPIDLTAQVYTILQIEIPVVSVDYTQTVSLADIISAFSLILQRWLNSLSYTNITQMEYTQLQILDIDLRNPLSNINIQARLQSIFQIPVANIEPIRDYTLLLTSQFRQQQHWVDLANAISMVFGNSDNRITIPSQPLDATQYTVSLRSFYNNVSDSVGTDPINHGVQLSLDTSKFSRYSAFFNGRSWLQDHSAATIFINRYDSNGNIIENSNDFTVECWFYINEIPSLDEYVIFDCRNSTSSKRGFALAIQKGTGYPIVASGDLPILTGNNAPVLNSWNHIAVTRTNNTLALYLNGYTCDAIRSYNFADGTFEIGSFDFSDGNYIVGKQCQGAGYFQGYINDFRITNGYCVYTSSSTAVDWWLSELTSIREPNNLDRDLLCRTAKMIGFDYRSDLLLDNDYKRLVQFYSLYTEVNGTDDFLNFLGFIKNTKFEMYALWSRGYTEDTKTKRWLYNSLTKQSDFLSTDITIFDDPTNSKAMFPTSHVELDFNINFGAPYEDQTDNMRKLFYLIAPIHLVMEKIVGKAAAPVYFNVSTNGMSEFKESSKYRGASIGNVETKISTSGYSCFLQHLQTSYEIQPGNIGIGLDHYGVNKYLSTSYLKRKDWIDSPVNTKGNVGIRQSNIGYTSILRAASSHQQKIMPPGNAPIIFNTGISARYFSSGKCTDLQSTVEFNMLPIAQQNLLGFSKNKNTYTKASLVVKANIVGSNESTLFETDKQTIDTTGTLTNLLAPVGSLSIIDSVHGAIITNDSTAPSQIVTNSQTVVKTITASAELDIGAVSIGSKQSSDSSIIVTTTINNSHQATQVINATTRQYAKTIQGSIVSGMVQAGSLHRLLDSNLKDTQIVPSEVDLLPISVGQVAYSTFNQSDQKEGELTQSLALPNTGKNITSFSYCKVNILL